jgi:hypothetical protein
MERYTSGTAASDPEMLVTFLLILNSADIKVSAITVNEIFRKKEKTLSQGAMASMIT